MFPLLVPFFIAPLALGFDLDNGIIGVPHAECRTESVYFEFTAKNPFFGRIYAKGRAKDTECSQFYVPENGNRTISFEVEMGKCGMVTSRSIDPPGLLIEIPVVVSFHLFFLTNQDRAFRLRCLFQHPPSHPVVQSVDVSVIPSTEMNAVGQLHTQCTYSVHRGSEDGPLMRYATIGDKAVHVWECDSEQDEMGLLIHECTVSDSGEQDVFEILDSQGCVRDPMLLGNVHYDTKRSRAVAESHVYKFSDVSTVSFRCNIKLCSRMIGDCDFTPPQCKLPSDEEEAEYMRRFFALQQHRERSEPVEVLIPSLYRKRSRLLLDDPIPVEKNVVGVGSNDIMVFNSEIDAAAAAALVDGQELEKSIDVENKQNQKDNYSANDKIQTGTLSSPLSEDVSDVQKGSEVNKTGAKYEIRSQNASKNNLEEIVIMAKPEPNRNSDQLICIQNYSFVIMAASTLVTALIGFVIAVAVSTRVISNVLNRNKKWSPDSKIRLVGAISNGSHPNSGSNSPNFSRRSIDDSTAMYPPFRNLHWVPRQDLL